MGVFLANSVLMFPHYNLSKFDVVVLFHLAQFADDDNSINPITKAKGIVGGNIYPAQSQIAEKMGCSRQRVNRSIKKLVGECWVSAYGKSGKTNIYQLNMDKLVRCLDTQLTLELLRPELSRIYTTDELQEIHKKMMSMALSIPDSDNYGKSWSTDYQGTVLIWDGVEELSTSLWGTKN